MRSKCCAGGQSCASLKPRLPTDLDVNEFDVQDCKLNSWHFAERPMAEVIDAYRALVGCLRARGYSFICPSPETQARAVEGRGAAETLEDFFGWNLAAKRCVLDRIM
jgi:hypothetical protein